MNIIQITSHYPPHLGGVQNCVKEISERLAKRGHTVQVFTSDIGCKKKKLISTKNLKIYYLKSFEIAHTPIFPSLLFKLIKIPKNSILHVHVGQGFVGEIVYLVSIIRGIPYIAHYHADSMPSGKMGFLLPIYKKIFLKKIIKSAKQIIVPTKDYVKIIKNKYGLFNQQIKIIPNGIDLKKFKYNKNSIKINRPIKLLFVGNFSNVKNIPLLINSFESIVKKNYDSELYIIGTGDDKKKIIKLINNKKLDKKIFLCGRLEQKELFKKYSESDILIFPSKKESFGLVLLESLACGVPIVASNIEGIKNIIKDRHTGMLVNQTTEDFSSAIEKLINDQTLRENLIKNGLKEVKKYDWDDIIEKYIKVYKGLE